MLAAADRARAGTGTRDAGCCQGPQNGGVMGVSSVTLRLLADLASSLEAFVRVFTYVYILLILAYVLSSWIRMPYSPTLSRAQRFLYDVCDPYLRLFRRILPPLGPLDLSPLVAVFSLVVIQQVLISVIGRVL
jgi:YggT family protein